MESYDHKISTILERRAGEKFDAALIIFFLFPTIITLLFLSTF